MKRNQSIQSPGWAPFALLLAAFVLMSLIAPSGYVGGSSDDWQYLNAARCWREFGPCLPQDHWQGRWPVIAPLAAITAVAGESRFTVSLWPMIASFFALWLLALVGNRKFGSPVGWLASFLLLLTPAFTIQMLAPRVEAVELAFVLAGALAVLHWDEQRSGAMAFVAGLMFAMAVQVRETAAIATAFAAIYVISRKPRPSARDLILGALSFSIPFAVEFLVFAISAGDPFWRRRLSLGHTQIISSELLARPDAGSSPFFNPTYIANWRREMGIHVHWTVDGMLNLLVNPRAGISLTIVPLLLASSRRIADLASWRQALLLWAGALLYVAALTYGFALDPKSRLMVVPIAMAHVAFALLSWRLLKARRRALVVALWVLIALVGLAFRVGNPGTALAEPSARQWIATHPGDIEIDPNTHRELTLIKEARELPGLDANKGLFLYGASTDCTQLPQHGGLPSGALHLVAEKSLSRLGFIRAPWGALCLYKFEKSVSAEMVRQAIRSSRHDGAFILSPRPTAVLDRD